MGSPSSAMPSIWNAIAWRISLKTSSYVPAVATQPGRSGAYAEKLLGVFSMRIVYCIRSLTSQPGLLHDTDPSSVGKVIARLAGYCHLALLVRVSVLAMATTSVGQIPSILSDHGNSLSYFRHVLFHIGFPVPGSTLEERRILQLLLQEVWHSTFLRRFVSRHVRFLEVDTHPIAKEIP